MTSKRHSLPALLTLLSALGASGGCSFPDWETDAAMGCAGYAGGTCQAFARCGEAFLSPYGSIDACQSQLTESCTYAILQPDAFGTGAGAALCGESMQNVDCNGLINGELPAGCGSPSGKRSEGARCRVGGQCASARCAEHDGEWGVCRERLEVGDSCETQADCRTGLVCSVRGTCVVLGRRGDACDVGWRCRAPLACVAGSCASVEVAPSCQAFGDMLCARLLACSASSVRTVYGDLRTCAARNAWSCNASLSMVEGFAVGAGVAGCTRALDAVSCKDLVDHALPAACQILPGTRADGQACGSDAQCASTRCARGAGSACGVCSPLGGVSSACAADGDCAAALVCSGGSCRVPAALGASCDAAQRCAYPWVCAAGSCVEAVGLGAPCSFGDDRCDKYAGLMCGAAGSCEPWQTGFSGQACGQISRGWSVCSGGSSCSATSEGNMCIGPLAEGNQCTAGQAPFCLAPAQCLGGVCALPSSVSCP